MNSLLNSAFKGPRVVITTTVSTTPYTIDDTSSEALSVNATASTIVIYLPLISAGIGRSYTIRKTDASVNTVVITRTGSDLIEGGTTFSLTTQWQSVTIDNDGVQWHRVSTNSAASSGTTFAGTATGEVIFVNASLQGIGNTLFRWDNTNNRLGVGTATPAYALHVVGDANITGPAIFSNHLLVYTDTGLIGFGPASATGEFGRNLGMSTSNTLATNHTFGLALQTAGGQVSNAFTTGATLVSSTMNNFGPASAYNLYIGAHPHDGFTGADPTKLMTFVGSSPFNVGIGTGSPSQRLTVVGTIYSTTGGFKFPDGSVQTTAYTGGGTSAAGGSGAIQFASGTAFAADAANLYWDDTNNKLGIGRIPVSTGALVQVGNGDLGGSAYLLSADRMLAVSASSGQSYIATGQDATHMALLGWNYNATPANAYGTIGVYGYTNRLHIDASELRLQALSGGAVSIGDSISATNPQRALNLISTSAVMRILRISANSNTASPALEMMHRTSADGADTLYWDVGVAASTGFYFRDRSAADAIRMSIANTTGNVAFDTNTLYVDAVNNRVGIGNSTPNAMLDLLGGAGGFIKLRNSVVTEYVDVSMYDNSDNWVGAFGYGNPSASDPNYADKVYVQYAKDLVFGDSSIYAKFTAAGNFEFYGTVDFHGGRGVARVAVPASASATGTTGQIAWDGSFVYVCSATNTWKRTAVVTW